MEPTRADVCVEGMFITMTTTTAERTELVESPRGVTLCRRADGSAALAIFPISAFRAGGTALATVELPAPAGDELLAAFLG